MKLSEEFGDQSFGKAYWRKYMDGTDYPQQCKFEPFGYARFMGGEYLLEGLLYYAGPLPYKAYVSMEEAKFWSRTLPSSS